MKNFILKRISLFIFLVFALLSALTTQAQVSINSTGTPPVPGSMLDVSSTNFGILIPRVTYSAISGLTVQGLLVYVTSGGPSGNGFYYYDVAWKRLVDDAGILAVTAGGTGTSVAFTSGSVVFAGTGGVYTQDNSNFFWDDSNNRLGIGISTPVTNFHVNRSVASLVPAMLVSQTGTGDASFRYYLNHNGISSITTGIDDNDNHNFKISNATALKGTTYLDTNTLMRIHTESASKGITDINHQSRVRAFLSISQQVPSAVWTGIEFDMTSYDEHGEFVPGVPGGGIPGQFVVKEDGYYQINARAEFAPIDQTLGQGYVSIAIFKNGVPYAVGNNLQMTDFANELMEKNNAPVVSDVVYLLAGDKIEIHVFQTFGSPLANIIVSDPTLPQPDTPAITYVSIHKIS